MPAASGLDHPLGNAHSMAADADARELAALHRSELLLHPEDSGAVGGHDLHRLCGGEPGLDEELVVPLITESRERAPHAGRIHPRTEHSPGRYEGALEGHGMLEALVRDGPASGGVDLVPDLARWPAYTNRVTMKGRLGRHGEPVRLVESVEQDPARGITRFDQTFVVGRGRAGRGHRFSLTFRSLDVPAICRRLVNAGFRVEAVLGDYDGRGWDERADVWIILVKKM